MCTSFAFSQTENAPLFTTVSPDISKVSFINSVVDMDTLNFFLEDDLYNGSGVSVGDVNNDGLVDLYFVSNFGRDALYLNQGNMVFKDITQTAFEDDFSDAWKVGSTMADVNGDGFLDIYVCRRGSRGQKEEARRNLLFINNGDETFTEKAREYGIDDPGRGMDAAFFDYDQDGDLDLYVVNRKKNTSVMEQYTGQMDSEPMHANRLYKNIDGYFMDVTSRENGIVSFGFCLGVGISDLNNDGWPDLYVTNDYDLPDFLFINDQNGGFKNEMRQRIRHTSHYSMGIDIADINNDGFTDIFVPDMSNTNYEKTKTNMGSMSIANFWDRVKRGYPHQYMYNSLQLNLGQGYFSEIAHMAGVASSDWSWSPLLADFDMDGQLDIFISNGFYREVRDKDYTNSLKTYMRNHPNHFDYKKMLEAIPQTKEVNFFFRNKGDLTFEDVSVDWGMNFGTVSHGAAYADLDNDGDLDLVINNVNEVPTLLQNNGSGQNYLQVELKGPSLNTKAIGAKVELKTSDGIQIRELYPSKGYASSSDYTLHFGLGSNTEIEQLTIFWNSKEMTQLPLVKTNQKLVVDYENSTKTEALYLIPFNKDEDIFVDVEEAAYDDYEREILLPHKMSQLGPFMSSDDVNGDGKDDLFIGGGNGTAGRLLLSLDNDIMLLKPQAIFEQDAHYEDAQSVFFDADMDGDLDLYVVSGGNEFEKGSWHYQDRLYINAGDGNFKRDSAALPLITTSGQCVIPNDFDQDGDIDLFVGGRQVPGEYPKTPQSYWLVNSNGKFEDKIAEIAPELQFYGMITDAQFTDLNEDGELDLVVVGEWTSVGLFIQKENQFTKDSQIYDGSGLYGWWNTVEVYDLDGDGNKEILLGNLGLNNKFHPNADHELQVYLEDFDENGQLDIILSKFFSGVEHPVRGRECLSDQIPSIAERYSSYSAFAQAQFGDIFEGTEKPLAVNNFSNGFLQKVDGRYQFTPFPNMAQIGPINKFIPADFNGDGRMDFIVIGNRYEAEIETPRYDGNPGLVLINKGELVFDIFPLEQGGEFANKNAKDAILLNDQLYISNAMESVNKITLFLH